MMSEYLIKLLDDVYSNIEEELKGKLDYIDLLRNTIDSHTEIIPKFYIDKWSKSIDEYIKKIRLD